MRHSPPARVAGLANQLTQSPSRARAFVTLTRPETFCVVFTILVAGIALGLLASAWLALPSHR